MGEKCPFYNPFKKPDMEDKDVKEFNPKLDYTIKKSGAFRYAKQSVINTEPMEKRDELIKEKADKVSTKWDEKKINFSGNSIENLNRISERGRCYFKYYKVGFLNYKPT